MQTNIPAAQNRHEQCTQARSFSGRCGALGRSPYAVRRCGPRIQGGGVPIEYRRLAYPIPVSHHFIRGRATGGPSYGLRPHHLREGAIKEQHDPHGATSIHPSIRPPRPVPLSDFGSLSLEIRAHSFASVHTQSLPERCATSRVSPRWSFWSPKVSNNNQSLCTPRSHV